MDWLRTALEALLVAVIGKLVDAASQKVRCLCANVRTKIRRS